MPSGKDATVTVSPPPATGRTCNVLFLSSRRDVKARRRPSGDQTGLASLCSPLLKGSGGVEPSAAASHTWLRYVFSASSTRVTTNAMHVPSGETHGLAGGDEAVDVLGLHGCGR